MVKILVNQDYLNSSRIVNHPSAVAAGDVVIKSDLDAAVAGLSGISVQIPTDLDCSGDPNYPATDAGASYYVTVAGKIGGASGINVNVGDQIICKNPAGSPGGDQATVGSDFFIVESNRDQATETTLGVIELASQTEVNDGVNAITAVTPLTLQTKLNNAFSGRRYSAGVGNGTNNTFNITHSLNTSNPVVQIRETGSPFEQVVADIGYLDPNTISLAFTNPPTTNQYTVIVQA